MKHHFLSNDDFMLIESRSSWDWGRLYDTSSERFRMSHGEWTLFNHCKLIRSVDLTLACEYVGSMIERPQKKVALPTCYSPETLGQIAIKQFCVPDEVYTAVDCYKMEKAIKSAVRWADQIGQVRTTWKDTWAGNVTQSLTAIHGIRVINDRTGCTIVNKRGEKMFRASGNLHTNGEHIYRVVNEGFAFRILQVVKQNGRKYRCGKPLVFAGENSQIGRHYEQIVSDGENVEIRMNPNNQEGVLLNGVCYNYQGQRVAGTGTIDSLSLQL